MNLCKGVCERLEIKIKGQTMKYENNQKRCPVCEVFMICLDVRCPCCSCILRVTPRTNKYRKSFHKRKNASRH